MFTFHTTLLLIEGIVSHMFHYYCVIFNRDWYIGQLSLFGRPLDANHSLLDRAWHTLGPLSPVKRPPQIVTGVFELVHQVPIHLHARLSRLLI